MASDTCVVHFGSPMEGGLIVAMNRLDMVQQLELALNPYRSPLLEVPLKSEEWMTLNAARVTYVSDE